MRGAKASPATHLLVRGHTRENASNLNELAVGTLITKFEGTQRGREELGGEMLDVRDIDPASVRAWMATTPLPDEAADALYSDRTDPLFPLRVPLRADSVGLVGWLLLGPRPDGSFFGREDRSVLKEIAEPVARAIAIANERTRREAARDAEVQVRCLRARVPCAADVAQHLSPGHRLAFSQIGRIPLQVGVVVRHGA